MDTKFCQKCGHKLAVNDVFCNYCGAKQHDLNLDENNMNNTSSYDNSNNSASNNNFNNGYQNAGSPYNNYQNFGAPYNNFNNGFQNNGSSYNNGNLNTGTPYNNFNNGAPNNGMPYNNNFNNGFNNTNQNGQLYANNQSNYVGFSDATKLFWKNSFSFAGRSSRSECWFGSLFSVMVLMGVLSVLLLTALAMTDPVTSAGSFDVIEALILLLATIVIVFLSIGNISLMVRRLHDINLSGAFYLLTLIPYVGGWIMVVFACIPTSPKSSRFGKRDDEMWFRKVYAWIILVLSSLVSFIIFLIVIYSGQY